MNNLKTYEGFFKSKPIQNDKPTNHQKSWGYKFIKGKDIVNAIKLMCEHYNDDIIVFGNRNMTSGTKQQFLNYIKIKAEKEPNFIWFIVINEGSVESEPLYYTLTAETEDIYFSDPNGHHPTQYNFYNWVEENKYEYILQGGELGLL